MNFMLKVGEERTITDPKTGDPITVRVVAGEDGDPTVVVDAAPGRSIRVRASGDAKVIYRDTHTLH